MISGGLVVLGVLDNMAIHLSSPVYYYVYDHLNEIIFNSQYGTYPKKLGVTHNDETISLFSTNDQPELKGEDLKVSKLMVDRFTRFASTDPLTIDGLDPGTKWPMFNAKDMEYYFID